MKEKIVLIPPRGPMPLDTDVVARVKLAGIPVGQGILGLGPIGTYWTATKTKTGLKPYGGLHPDEFVPCYTWIKTEGGGHYAHVDP